MASEQTGSTAPATTLSRARIWGPPAAVAVLIFLLSSTPGTFLPAHPEYANNVIHFLEFCFLGFLLARALSLGHRLGGTGLVVSTILICTAFGLLDETHQFLVPQRIFDFRDLFYDALGAAAGSFGYTACRRMKGADPRDGSSVGGGPDG